MRELQRAIAAGDAVVASCALLVVLFVYVDTNRGTIVLQKSPSHNTFVKNGAEVQAGVLLRAPAQHFLLPAYILAPPWSQERMTKHQELAFIQLDRLSLADKAEEPASVSILSPCPCLRKKTRWKLFNLALVCLMLKNLHSITIINNITES